MNEPNDTESYNVYIDETKTDFFGLCAVVINHSLVDELREQLKNLILDINNSA